MKPVKPLALAHEFALRLKPGAFLTVQAGDELNTMTIGWGLLGFLWQRPVLMVPVRNSRHTYGLLERAQDFTVSMPTTDAQREALHLCGTRSGRDLDKLSASGLRPRPAQNTTSPILDIPALHLECRIVLRAPMDPALLDPTLLDLYPERDFHTLYHGAIVASYETEG